MWFLSVPVLVWLWRLAATHRKVTLPSLIPFEHLLARPPRQRSRLLVNLLFWLQLAALVGMTLALAQPAIPSRPIKRVLIVLDTSASMEASGRRGSALDRAKRAALARIARTRPGEEVFIVVTSPVGGLTPQPTSDATMLAQAVQRVSASHLPGNLATAARIGRALLGAAPDEIVAISDEPLPETLGERVRLISVGEPLPNVAIVGVEAHGPLCRPTDARLLVTVQNFSTEPAQVTLTARHRGRQVASAQATIPPQLRHSIALAMGDDVDGGIEVRLTAEQDHLAADNTAWVEFTQRAALPIVVHSEHPAFVETVGSWLDACEALTWTTELPTEGRPILLITDEAREPPDVAAATLRFLPQTGPQPTVSYWLASADHPIGSYFAPVDVVAASLHLDPGPGAHTLPVISAVIEGRRLPVVVTDDRGGRRSVTLALRPEASRHSTPVLLAFFNSLRWLLGGSQALRVVDPIRLRGFQPGPVRVVRPDGRTDTVTAANGTLDYHAGTVVGRYRFLQGTADVSVGLNLFDPLESNLLSRASTWTPSVADGAGGSSPASSPTPPTQRKLSHLLMWWILLLLLVEWRLYCTGAGGQGRGTGGGL